MNNPDSDRLVDVGVLPAAPIADVSEKDDMLDMQNNPVAQQFNSMIAASTKAHRQKVIDRMQQATTPAPGPVLPPIAAPIQPMQPQPTTSDNNYWFLNQPAQPTTVVPQNTVTFNTQVVTPGTPVTDLPVAAATPTADEEQFIKSHKNEPAFSPNMHGHLHVIQPLSAQNNTAAPAPSPAQAAPAQNITATPTPQVTRQPDTAILDLARNDDLNVATIAREAQKRKEPPADEVVISLH